MKWAICAAPVVEVFIGIAVWFRHTRLPAIIAAIAVHLSALIFLGPLGHQHNWIVWPWNLVMPVLVFILFPPKPPGDAWAALRRCGWSAFVVALFWLLPVLSFFEDFRRAYEAFAAKRKPVFEGD